MSELQEQMESHLSIQDSQDVEVVQEARGIPETRRMGKGQGWSETAWFGGSSPLSGVHLPSTSSRRSEEFNMPGSFPFEPSESNLGSKIVPAGAYTVTVASPKKRSSAIESANRGIQGHTMNVDSDHDQEVQKSHHEVETPGHIPSEKGREAPNPSPSTASTTLEAKNISDSSQMNASKETPADSPCPGSSCPPMDDAEAKDHGMIPSRLSRIKESQSTIAEWDMEMRPDEGMPSDRAAPEGSQTKLGTSVDLTSSAIPSGAPSQYPQHYDSDEDTCPVRAFHLPSVAARARSTAVLASICDSESPTGSSHLSDSEGEMMVFAKPVPVGSQSEDDALVLPYLWPVLRERSIRPKSIFQGDDLHLREEKDREYSTSATHSKSPAVSSAFNQLRPLEYAHSDSEELVPLTANPPVSVKARGSVVLAHTHISSVAQSPSTSTVGLEPESRQDLYPPVDLIDENGLVPLDAALPAIAHFIRSTEGGDEAFDADTEDNIGSGNIRRYCGRRTGVSLVAAALAGEGTRGKRDGRSHRASVVSRRKIVDDYVPPPDPKIGDPLEDGHVSGPADYDGGEAQPVPAGIPGGNGYSYEVWAERDARLNGDMHRLSRMLKRKADKCHRKSTRAGQVDGECQAVPQPSIPVQLGKRSVSSSIVPRCGKSNGGVRTGATVARQPQLEVQLLQSAAEPSQSVGSDLELGAMIREIYRALVLGPAQSSQAVGPLEESSSSTSEEEELPKVEKVGPNGRGADKNILQARIREHMAQATKRLPKGPPKGSKPIPYVLGWATNRRDTQCQIETDEEGDEVQFCLADTSKLAAEQVKAVHLWNDAKIAKLVPMFLRRYPEYKGKEKEIRRRMSTHFRHLKNLYRIYRIGGIDSDGAVQSRMQSNSRQRRMNRYWRRVFSALKNKEKFPQTAVFYDIMANRLTWRACSGDEEDDEICQITGKNRHIITTLKWLSEEARDWMRQLDWIDLCRRFPDGQRSTSGNFPDPRYDPRDLPEREACPERFNNGVIKGLPENFYDEDWLVGVDRDALNMQGSIDLTYPPELEAFIHVPVPDTLVERATIGLLVKNHAKLTFAQLRDAATQRRILSFFFHYLAIPLASFRPEVVGQAYQEFVDKTHPVFQLVPPTFANPARTIYDVLNQPNLNHKTFWDIYSAMLDRVEDGICTGAIPGAVVCEWADGVLKEARDDDKREAEAEESRLSRGPGPVR
ncbi:hypothetical protein NMY22_g4643 [Coprinellus aureogranulatus]|nr:hypothetical protein NMY22_g4643 [Coprinellus aureogranulatus]